MRKAKCPLAIEEARLQRDYQLQAQNPPVWDFIFSSFELNNHKPNVKPARFEPPVDEVECTSAEMATETQQPPHDGNNAYVGPVSSDLPTYAARIASSEEYQPPISHVLNGGGTIQEIPRRYEPMTD